MISKDSYLYLLCLFFFKVAVGAILLATGWDSLGISGNGLVNVTVIMTLSFFPATFARPIFKAINHVSTSTIVTLSLFASAILIICESVFMNVSLLAFYITHFILWIFIFVIDVACEKWYVSVAQGYSLDKTRKLSGISTGVGQLGIILGPIAVMLSTVFNKQLPYGIIFICFIASSIFPIIANLKLRIQDVTSIHSSAEFNAAICKDKIWYILGFSLVWPTLTIFNLSIPILANSQFNSINVAGALEILIALSMALSGFMHPYITIRKKFKYQILLMLAVLFASSTISYIYNNNLILVSSAVFLIGLSFGYLRVELRAYLSKLFTSDEAGEIISSANGLSGLLVIAYASMFYFNNLFEVGNGLTFSFPISFIIFGCITYYILNFKSKMHPEFIRE